MEIQHAVLRGHVALVAAGGLSVLPAPLALRTRATDPGGGAQLAVATRGMASRDVNRSWGSVSSVCQALKALR